MAKEYFGDGLDTEVRSAVEAAIQKLAQVGCEVIPVSLPHTEYAIPTYYIVATAEASSNLARYDGVRYGYRAKNLRTLSDMYRRTRDEGFGVEVKRRIMPLSYLVEAVSEHDVQLLDQLQELVEQKRRELQQKAV